MIFVNLPFELRLIVWKFYMNTRKFYMLGKRIGYVYEKRKIKDSIGFPYYFNGYGHSVFVSSAYFRIPGTVKLCGIYFRLQLQAICYCEGIVHVGYHRCDPTGFTFESQNSCFSVDDDTDIRRYWTYHDEHINTYHYIEGDEVYTDDE